MDNLPKARTRFKLKVFLETKCFRAKKNVLCYCTAKWKASHINTFFPKPLSTSSLLFSLSETEKNNKTFSVRLVAKHSHIVDLNPCLIMGLQLHFSLFYWIFLWHLTPLPRDLCKQPGSRGSSHMPHMYGKGLHPTVSEGGQCGSEVLPWLGIWACLPLNFFLLLPSCHQIWHPTCEKCSSVSHFWWKSMLHPKLWASSPGVMHDTTSPTLVLASYSLCNHTKGFY